MAAKQLPNNSPFPKTLFVKSDAEFGDDPIYTPSFFADPDPARLGVEAEEQVAEYTLVKVGKLKVTTELI